MVFALPVMLLVVVPVKVTVDVPQVKAPLFVQLPPTLIVAVPALNVPPDEIVRLPLSVAALNVRLELVPRVRLQVCVPPIVREPIV